MDGGRDKTTDGLRELSSLPDEELAPSGLQAELVRERVKAALFGEPAQPRRLGRFVLLDQIGVGGLGTYTPRTMRR